MESKNSGISACVPRAEDSLVRRGSAESNSSPHTRAGGSMEGGMERGLEAESTSFSRYKRVECAGGNGRIERDELGRKQRRRLTEEREKERREEGCEISYVWLSVRPSEPGGTSAATKERRSWQIDAARKGRGSRAEKKIVRIG